jgi:hypothetical protein
VITQNGVKGFVEDTNGATVAYGITYPDGHEEFYLKDSTRP